MKEEPSKLNQIETICCSGLVSVVYSPKSGFFIDEVAFSKIINHMVSGNTQLPRSTAPLMGSESVIVE